MCKLPKVKKRDQIDLIDIGILRNIDIAPVTLLLTLKRFHTFSYYFIVAFVELATEIKVQRTKNYETCKDRWKSCHANETNETYNPASYLKDMQNVGFEKISTKFLLNLFCCVKITSL